MRPTVRTFALGGAIAAMACAMPKSAWGQAPAVPEVALDPSGSPVRIEEIWYDGRGTVWAASSSAVHALTLDEPAISWPTDLPGVVAGAGYAGRDPLVAFASPDGLVVRHTGDGWAAERLSLAEGERVVAVAVDGSADVYVVSDRAVHVWRRDHKKAFPLPDEAVGHVHAVVVSAGGRVYITGDEALVLAFDGKQFDRVIPVGPGQETLESSWSAGWLSADGHRLWVRAADDRVVRVDVRDGAAIEYTLPRDRGVGTDGTAREALIAGASLASDDQVVTVMNGTVFGLFVDRFVPLASLPAGEATDLVVASDEGAGYAVIDGRLVAFDLDPEREPSYGVAADETQRRKLEHIFRRDRRRDAHSPYPKHGLYVPSVDVRLGPSWTVAPGGAAPRTSFALDAGAGVLIAPFEPTDDDPTWWFWPQAGYTLDTHPDFGHHGAYIANGFGFGSSLVAAYYTPGLLVGRGRGDTMVGFRHGISAQALWGAVGLEFRHQVQSVGDRVEQDLGLMFSLNLAPLIWLAVVANMK